MSVPSNTQLTYATVGQPEDLSDVIFNISPVDTLFSSKLAETSKGNKNIKHEWQTDSLRAAASNAQLEGDDATINAHVATTRLYNMHQILMESFALSGTQEAVDTKGRVSELDYQTAKKTKELSKDVEYALLQEVRVDGGAGTARKMRGALNWTTTNLNKDSGATLNADGTVTGGSTRALTQTILDNTLQLVYVSGGDPKVAYMGPFQKRAVSGFTGTGNYRRPIEEKKLINTVDVYVNDFFILTLKPHRNFPTDVVFICDHDYWKKKTLRKVNRVELAKTGDSRKFQILGEMTIESCQEAASGRITSLTTS